MAMPQLPKNDAPPYSVNVRREEPAPPYSPPSQRPGPSAPPYSNPNVQYNFGGQYDYSQYNPYTINQPDPCFYPMAPPAPLPSTTVVIQQPMAGRGPAGRRMWSSGICDCCNDMGTCCCGTFCYPCLACQVATDMGESVCVPCIVPGWLTTLRTKMRAEQNIAGTVLDDCCTAFFCTPCALCQLAREMKLSRGQSALC